MTNGSLDYMQINNIVPMAWNPLGSIFKSNDEKNIKIKKTAVKLCEKYNIEIDVLLLIWIIKHPAGVLPVVGTTDRKRISKLNEINEINFGLEDWFELYTASLGHKVA